MSSPAGVDEARAARERAAYDEGGVDAAMAEWHGRFPHVFTGPNTRRHEDAFDAETRRAVAGGRVIDIGCGPGETSVRLLEMGAGSVVGIDVSETEIAKGRDRAAQHGDRLELRVADVTQAVEGTFDAIFGRSILHHLDYRGFLPRLYRDNLRPGGAMLFREPLGTGLLIRAYDRLVPAAHTDDEQSLMPDDLDWLRRNMPGVEITPINWLSFPAAVVTSLLPGVGPDNALLRACDRADEALARRPRMQPRFRQCAIVVRKPA